VRDDCIQRLDELDNVMPTLVFEVKDASGNDLSTVTVTMDGQPFAQRVGGAAVAVDPGEHRFTFQAPGSSSTDKTVVVREGEKARRVQVALGTTTETPSGPGKPSSATSDGNTQRLIALVVGGAGVVGLVIGGVFGIVSKSTYNNAFQNECGSNTNGCSSKGAQDGQTAFSQATISTVGFVTGAALLAGGAVIYFTAPKGTGVAVAPTVGTAGGGLSVIGAW
jgi:serine/threonine-protein kinase